MLTITGLEVGILDSAGKESRPIQGLCPFALHRVNTPWTPKGQLMVHYTVANTSGDAAPRSLTRVSLLNTEGRILWWHIYSTEAIAAGASLDQTQGPIPMPRITAPDQLTVRVRADAHRGQADIGPSVMWSSPLSVATGNPEVYFVVGSPTFPDHPHDWFGLDLPEGSNNIVFPGQDVPVQWALHNYCRDLGAVGVNITWDQQAALPLLVRNGLQAPLQGVLGDAPSGQVVTRPFQEHLDIPVGLKAAFFSFSSGDDTGVRSLQIEVIGQDGSGINSRFAFNTLQLALENVGSWWQWSDDVPATANWKDTYPIDGTLSNPLHFAGVKPQEMELIETELARGTVVAVVRRQLSWPDSLDVGVSHSMAMSARQDWDWFLPVFLIPALPPDDAFAKTFRYQVSLNFDDEFGNSYESLLSDTVDVSVAVSLEKQLYYFLAVALLVLGIILLIMTICVLVAGVIITVAALVGTVTAETAGLWAGIAGLAAAALAGLSATALAFSQAAAQVAQDPLGPDFSYLTNQAATLVGSVTSAVSGAVLSGPGSYQFDPGAIKSTLDLIAKIMNAMDVMKVTRARLRAARIDGSAQGIDEQLSAYQDAFGVMERAADATNGLPSVVAQAAADLDAIPIPQASIETMLERLQQDGVPNAVHDWWVNSNLPMDAYDNFVQVVPRAPTPIGSPGAALQKASDTLMRIVRIVEEETPAILAG